jgi:phosphoglycolate phosphatase-like HAD superfamily hydrolase
MHNLDVYITAVSARASSDPLLMKPNPHLIGKALSDLHVSASDAIFIGDSPTDVEACIAVRVACVGYANKPGKSERLARAGAVDVIDSMKALTE